ncbi:hypothetical protein [Sphingobacterium bovistauri]|uniref:Uncharacterized protein n=1 Tax=Sphingobacterium bovistauri TaxID=2781959 RepID=A0ABS7Z3W0_9SPHI|nr:hypothetical protein [Sphingobacterium bovistauri]MCA5004837.1 hypothetical protein [Sphingobacterium bovistauri]
MEGINDQKRPYVQPKISVQFIVHEECIAASSVVVLEVGSPGSPYTPTIEDWNAGTGDNEDVWF